MTKRNQLILCTGGLIGALVLLSLVTALSALPANDSLFSSELPTPRGRPAGNPNAIKSESGGRVYCGSEQSSSWLDIPAGFTSEWGAEFHCSAAVTLKSWGNQTGMWSNQGFLIGIYPAGVPLAKPVKWVQEIDPVQVKGPCNQCLVGRYYQPASKTWVNLPTAYEASLGRVTIEIGANRPASGYPGYPDRVLVALFQTNSRATTTAQVPASAATGAARATASVQTASTLALMATNTAPAAGPTAMAIPTISSSPAPAAESSTPLPAAMDTPLEPKSAPAAASGSDSPPSPPDAGRSGSNLILLLLGMIALLLVAVLAALVLLIRKKS